MEEFPSFETNRPVPSVHGKRRKTSRPVRVLEFSKILFRVPKLVSKGLEEV